MLGRWLACRSRDLGLVTLALSISAWHLHLGVGPLMDDWYALNNAHFGRWWEAAGSAQMAARPGAGVTYAVAFGLFGGSMVPAVVAMGALNGVAACLLRRLLGLVGDDRLASVAAACWLILPTATALEVWASAANITIARCAALGALWAAAGQRELRSATVAAGLLSAWATLSYEATAALILPASVVLLLWRPGRRLPAAVMIASCGLSLGWMATHWHPVKVVRGWGDVAQVVPANLIWCFGPHWLRGAVGISLLVVCALLLSRFVQATGIEGARRLLLVGWALLLLGALPFVRYTYAPLGAGDRVNVVSSIGGAVIVAGALTTVVDRLCTQRNAAKVVVVLVAVLSFGPRLTMMRSWHLAVDDGDRLLRAVETQAGDHQLVVFGPGRVDRNGVTAMQHSDIFESAVQLTLDDSRRRALLVDSEQALQAATGAKIDLRLVIPDPEAPGTP